MNGGGQRRGFTPDPDQGSALDPPKSEALWTLSMGGYAEGVCQDLDEVLAHPLRIAPKRTGSKGYRPWRGPGAEPLAGSRAEPSR